MKNTGDKNSMKNRNTKEKKYEEIMKQYEEEKAAREQGREIKELKTAASEHSKNIEKIKAGKEIKADKEMKSIGMVDWLVKIAKACIAYLYSDKDIENKNKDLKTINSSDKDIEDKNKDLKTISENLSLCISDMMENFMGPEAERLFEEKYKSLPSKDKESLKENPKLLKEQKYKDLLAEHRSSEFAESDYKTFSNYINLKRTMELTRNNIDEYLSNSEKFASNSNQFIKDSLKYLTKKIVEKLEEMDVGNKILTHLYLPHQSVFDKGLFDKGIKELKEVLKPKGLLTQEDALKGQNITPKESDKARSRNNKLDGMGR